MNRIRHCSLEHWPVADDCLVVGGLPLPELAKRVGRTPFYVYDHGVIDRRIEMLRQTFPPGIKLHYAIKANPMPALVQHVGRAVDGFDVASGGEIAIALAAGMAIGNISFAGPGKSESELAAARAAGVLINVESLREVDFLARAASLAGPAARIAVRINPDFELKTSGMKMGGGSKHFGVDAEAVPDLLARIHSCGLTVEGFHIFPGSQSLDAGAICDAQRLSVDLALRLAEHAPNAIQIINIGGGFGIPYFPGDEPLDIAPIGQNLARLQEHVTAALPRASIAIELGRYLVGEAGLYICRVIDRKISRGHVFLVTDGGMHHHLAASGNLGQVIRKNFPVVIGNHVQGRRRETASVVGPFCTPLDVLADRLELAEAHEGDLVAIFQSGAYGYTASPVAFLSHPAPAEIFL